MLVKPTAACLSDLRMSSAVPRAHRTQCNVRANSPKSLQRRTICRTSRCPVPPVNLVKPCGQGGADQQVIVTAARRDAPAQELAGSGKDLERACRQLMTIDPGYVGAVVGVLLDPAPIDQP